MEVFNIHEAKTNLSKLIQRALKGEDVVIAKGGRPMVRLVVCPEATHQRTLGGGKDLIEIADDFDEPLDDFAEYC